MADELEINITTNADTSGAKAAAQSLDEIGAAGKEMGQEVESGTGQASGGMSGFGAGLKATKALTGALSQAMSGDLGGALKATMLGFKALTLAFRANPFGLLIGALSVVLPLLNRFRTSSDETAGAAEKASSQTKGMASGLHDVDTEGKKAAGSVQGAATAATTMGNSVAAAKAQLDEYKQTVKEIAEAHAEWLKTANEQVETNGALAQSFITLREAKGEISPSQAKVASIASAFSDKEAKLSNKIAANNSERNRLSAEAEKKRKIKDAAEADAAKLEAMAGGASVGPDEIAAALEKAKSEQKSAEIGVTEGDESRPSGPSLEEARQRVAQLEREQLVYEKLAAAKERAADADKKYAEAKSTFETKGAKLGSANAAALKERETNRNNRDAALLNAQADEKKRKEEFERQQKAAREKAIEAANKGNLKEATDTIGRNEQRGQNEIVRAELEKDTAEAQGDTAGMIKQIKRIAELKKALVDMSEQKAALEAREKGEGLSEPDKEKFRLERRKADSAGRDEVAKVEERAAKARERAEKGDTLFGGEKARQIGAGRGGRGGRGGRIDGSAPQATPEQGLRTGDLGGPSPYSGLDGYRDRQQGPRAGASGSGSGGRSGTDDSASRLSNSAQGLQKSTQAITQVAANIDALATACSTLAGKVDTLQRAINIIGARVNRMDSQMT